MAENEELIWVDKEFAEQLNKLKTEGGEREQLLKALNDYMQQREESTRNQFKIHLETIEEDAAVYTGLLLQVKQSFQKAKEEHAKDTYDLWEKFEEELPSVREKVGKIVAELQPLATQLREINQEIGKIQTWDIGKLFEMIQQISELYGENKEMVQFLVNNYKRQDQEAADG